MPWPAWAQGGLGVERLRLEAIQALERMCTGCIPEAAMRLRQEGAWHLRWWLQRTRPAHVPSLEEREQPLPWLLCSSPSRSPSPPPAGHLACPALAGPYHTATPTPAAAGAAISEELAAIDGFAADVQGLVWCAQAGAQQWRARLEGAGLLPGCLATATSAWMAALQREVRGDAHVVPAGCGCPVPRRAAVSCMVHSAAKAGPRPACPPAALGCPPPTWVLRHLAHADKAREPRPSCSVLLPWRHSHNLSPERWPLLLRY
jgi:hypothetical protein